MPSLWYIVFFKITNCSKCFLSHSIIKQDCSFSMYSVRTKFEYMKLLSFLVWMLHVTLTISYLYILLRIKITSFVLGLGLVFGWLRQPEWRKYPQMSYYIYHYFFIVMFKVRALEFCLRRSNAGWCCPFGSTKAIFMCLEG